MASRRTNELHGCGKRARAYRAESRVTPHVGKPACLLLSPPASDPWCAGAEAKASARRLAASPAAAVPCAQQLATTKTSLTKTQASVTALTTQLRTCATQKAALVQQLRYGGGGLWLSGKSADGKRYSHAVVCDPSCSAVHGLDS